MTIKIPAVVRKICTVCFRWNNLLHKWPGRTPSKPPPADSTYPPYYALKLAKVRIAPKLKLMSFRVSKNFLYLSFARTEKDLLEFNGLCTEDLALAD